MATRKKQQLSSDAIFTRAPSIVRQLINYSHWHIRKSPSQMVREAIVEYIEKYTQDADDDTLIEMLKKAKKAIGIQTRVFDTSEQFQRPRDVKKQK